MTSKNRGVIEAPTPPSPEQLTKGELDFFSKVETKYEGKLARKIQREEEKLKRERLKLLSDKMSERSKIARKKEVKADSGRVLKGNSHTLKKNARQKKAKGNNNVIKASRQVDLLEKKERLSEFFLNLKSKLNPFPNGDEPTEGELKKELDLIKAEEQKELSLLKKTNKDHKREELLALDPPKPQSNPNEKSKLGEKFTQFFEARGKKKATEGKHGSVLPDENFVQSKLSKLTSGLNKIVEKRNQKAKEELEKNRHLEEKQHKALDINELRVHKENKKRHNHLKKSRNEWVDEQNAIRRETLVIEEGTRKSKLMGKLSLEEKAEGDLRSVEKKKPTVPKSIRKLFDKKPVVIEIKEDKLRLEERQRSDLKKVHSLYNEIGYATDITLKFKNSVHKSGYERLAEHQDNMHESNLVKQDEVLNRRIAKREKELLAKELKLLPKFIAQSTMPIQAKRQLAMDRKRLLRARKISAKIDEARNSLEQEEMTSHAEIHSAIEQAKQEYIHPLNRMASGSHSSGGDVEYVLGKIGDAHDEMLRLNLIKVKLIYRDIMQTYLKLRPHEQRRVYAEIRDLYLSWKKAKDLFSK